MITRYRWTPRPLPAFLLTLFAIAAPYAAHAQTVQGRVVDAATQQPVAGAEIVLEDAGGVAGAAISQADGGFRVTAPAAGEYRLVVDQPGYALMESAGVRLAEGQVLQMDVRLVPESPAVPVSARPQAAAPLPGAGRGVAGRVAEVGSRRAVAGATVTLLNERGQGVGRAVTDAEGGFQLPVLAPGRFQLRAERVGYQASLSQPLTIAPSDAVQVELFVSTDAVVLAPLTVVASTRDVTRSSRMAAFEWRQEHHPWGRFLDPQQIARIRPVHASDILAQVPFVRISGNPPVRQATMRGRFGDRCMPTIYVDGHQVPAPAGTNDAPDRSSPVLAPFARSFPTSSPAGASDAGVNLDEMVSGTDVVAVEVYDKPFEAPAEFGPSTTQINCGVILVWTRQPGQAG
ncbi:carboxypeptidase regulatory-like domain-containing protein [Longimicrobium sp.]|uniref:carboxypeptidase regulatory-like domain-containing protein n=1 Tax=Longimicrobium sp. TaxID=2029185 RepID=UPI003B3A3280